MPMRPRTSWTIAAAMLAALVAHTGAMAGGPVLDERTFWRAHVTLAEPFEGDAEAGPPEKEEQRDDPHTRAPTPLPDERWHEPDFDDTHWARHAGDLYGGYGFTNGASEVAMIALRGRFGVEQPERAGQLTLQLAYRGGAVVYLNGNEIARKHLSDEPAADPVSTLADPYPEKAYLKPEGSQGLPITDRPADSHKQHYEARIRDLTIELPQEKLIEGDNVLAIALYRAPIRTDFDAEPYGGAEWGTAGLVEATLTADDDTSIRANLDRPSEVLVRAAPDIAAHDRPHAPLSPRGELTMTAPRGGEASAKAIISAPVEINDVEAEVSRLSHIDHDATLPEDAVTVRYDIGDGLHPRPHHAVKQQAAWLLLRIGDDVEPGDYEGTFRVRAGGEITELPVRVTVKPWRLPEADQRRYHVSLLHSPDTLALEYQVEPFSDEHFQLIEKSLEMKGRMGNDVLFVPVTRHTHLGHLHGMVRWIERDDGSYEPDFEPLERFLELYEEHAGEPYALVLDVYGGGNRNGGNDRDAPSVVTRLDPESGAMDTLEAPAYGAAESETFWKPMMDGVAERVREQGWEKDVVMLGNAFDSRPKAATFNFFNEIAPYARWSVFTHGRGDPPPRDGRLILGAYGDADPDAGMEVGYREAPYREYRGTPMHPGEIEYSPADKTYRDVSSLRGLLVRRGHVRESPLGEYRIFAPSASGFGRVGLDYWVVTTEDGQTGRLIGRWERQGNLYRDNPRYIAAPGVDGPVPTSRYQMLLEGVQEAEAKLYLERVLIDESRREALDDDLVERIEQALLDVRIVRESSRDVKELGLMKSWDWPGLTARLYELAGEVEQALEARDE